MSAKTNVKPEHAGILPEHTGKNKSEKKFEQVKILCPKIAATPLFFDYFQLPNGRKKTIAGVNPDNAFVDV